MLFPVSFWPHHIRRIYAPRDVLRLPLSDRFLTCDTGPGNYHRSAPIPTHPNTPCVQVTVDADHRDLKDGVGVFIIGPSLALSMGVLCMSRRISCSIAENIRLHPFKIAYVHTSNYRAATTPLATLAVWDEIREIYCSQLTIDKDRMRISSLESRVLSTFAHDIAGVTTHALSGRRKREPRSAAGTPRQRICTMLPSVTYAHPASLLFPHGIRIYTRRARPTSSPAPVHPFRMPPNFPTHHLPARRRCDHQEVMVQGTCARRPALPPRRCVRR